MLAWARTVGGTGERWGRDAAGLPDGSSVVVGTFDRIATFGHGEPGEVHLEAPEGWSSFVARFTPDGTLAWARAISGSEVYVQAVEMTPEGRSYVVGYFLGTADFGAVPDQGPILETPPLAVETGFLAAYEADGSLSWVHAFTGSPWAEVMDVAVRPEGGVVIGGQFAGGLPLGPDAARTPVEFHSETSGGFVAAYTADGSLQWARHVASGETGFATVWSVGCFADGGVLLAGDYQGTAGVQGATVASLGDRPDVLVARLAADGRLAWVRSVGGPTKDKVYGACVAPDGSFALVGDHRGPIRFGYRDGHPVGLDAAEGTDAWVAAFSGDGLPLWARGVGGRGVQYAAEVCVGEGGTFGVVGHFDEMARFDGAPARPTTVHAEPGQGPDAYVVRYDPAGRLLAVCALQGPGVDYGMGVGAAGTDGPLAVGVFEQVVSVVEEGAPAADLACEPDLSTYMVRLGR